MNIVSRLLRKNMSMSQMLGFILSNFAGLAIVMAGLQFFTDVRSLWTDDDSFIRKDYIVVNKRVRSGVSADRAETQFTPQEIDDISSQPWVRKVGEFIPTSYKVSASMGGAANSLSTLLFFEAVPRDFVDVPDADWTYKPGDTEVPIIMNRDYLNLYNFGFASSAGMPRLSENMIGSVNMQLTLYPEQDGVPVNLRGRVVGFSNRLNTILVPEEFIQWSNSNIGKGDVAPSRLIIDCSSPGDVRIKDYLDAHDLQLAGDKTASQASYFLNVATGAVLAVGALVTLLSFFILMLSIQLLMQKNRAKLHSLIMLGYDLRIVGAPYRKIVILVSFCAYALSVAAMLWIRSLYLTPIKAMGAETTGVWFSLAVTAILTLLTIVFNIISVNRRVRGAFRS